MKIHTNPVGTLTGRQRYRVEKRAFTHNLVVLQVEYTCPGPCESPEYCELLWRDAYPEDLMLEPGKFSP